MSSRVLVARPAGSGDALAERLGADGHAVDHVPFLELVPEDGDSLREAVDELAAGRFAWLVLTSAVAVDALSRLGTADTSNAGRLVVPVTTRTAVVGPGTAAALRARCVAADLVARGSGASLVAEMPDPSGSEAVLLPLSAAAAPTVPDGLAARGYRVRRETAYRPVETVLDDRVVDDVRAGAYDVMVLTSSMIARRAAALGLAARTRVVTIGTPTSAAARDAGLRVDVQAAAPTTEALVTAVAEALRPTLEA
ncbi:uroporphyrinogen-III synthase [Brachybacterium huguangmaarense]|uniref:Uroporphyrinogen-III synthase n=1 Tax=Brachybacterium huguangmaarense TaxID=1652028 RepID=A0ABY6G3Y0_9MICO|nr:uroporphyrinogen-III synthase [Brachybacterium huguangmaarense]UYG17916.1 uroporphyrinogen-III synthase [Brachybacterium huguangmaarense]